jgi:LPXTG-motif cell wall-anchored protein
MFDNCTELREVFPNGVKEGHWAYEDQHDRDNDGYACETPGKEAEAATKPASTVQASTTTREQLPLTGPGEVTAIGAFVVIMGLVALVAFRRRKVHFRA